VTIKEVLQSMMKETEKMSLQIPVILEYGSTFRNSIMAIQGIKEQEKMDKVLEYLSRQGKLNFEIQEGVVSVRSCEGGDILRKGFESIVEILGIYFSFKFINNGRTSVSKSSGSYQGYLRSSRREMFGSEALPLTLKGLRFYSDLYMQKESDRYVCDRENFLAKASPFTEILVQAVSDCTTFHVPLPGNVLCLYEIQDGGSCFTMIRECVSNYSSYHYH